MPGTAALNKFPPAPSVGWAAKQFAHAQSILGNQIDDYATALDFISPGGYTLIGAMARQNKGKGRVISTGAGNAQAVLGAADTVSILDNPLTEAWYISGKIAVAISPSATAFIDIVKLNGVSTGTVGLRLDGSVSQTKFKIYTINGGAAVTANFAASVGVEIQLGVDFTGALAYDPQVGQLTAYIDQVLQATLTNLSQMPSTIANVQHFQFNQTGVAECDDLFIAFKR
jgi:hypothetical protein